MNAAVDTSRVRPSHAVLKLLPAKTARAIGALPLASEGDVVTVCLADATDFAAVERVEALLPGRQVVFVEAQDPGDFRRALRENYPDAALTGDLERPENLFAHVLRRALARNASDIHVCPAETETLVRLRVDGRLVTDLAVTSAAAGEFVSYLKVLASLDIAEKRAPQDGNIDTEVNGLAVSLRVATVPTIHGEHVTLRILSQTRATKSLDTLDNLGFHPRQRRLFEEALALPDGVVILSGPTGSGKTTTLYAALRRLAQPDDLHLVSIEDPVEKPVAGVTQIKVDSRQERVSFDKALRSVLRHDPDVVMIGEIRDGETATTALRSALTGHLVLTTLHTNSAPGILTRLVDLGVPPYLVASTLRLAVAQRLLRRPCRECMTWATADAETCRKCGWDEAQPPRIPKVRGCAYCGNTGYSGRTAIYEMLPVGDAVRRLLLQGESEGDICRWLGESAPDLTLRGDALAKVLEGETTLEEYRATVAEELCI
ncbi:MAG: GspE/PulE family protein [Kiritimatiellia bacterium]